MDMSNSDIGKYYVTKKYDIPDSSASELTSKIWMESKAYIFFYKFFKRKKRDRYVSHIRFTFHSKIHKSNIHWNH